MRHLFISAAHKSSGKTTVSTGLSAALTAAGQSIQTFKKGPDYIDPMWLAAASRKPSYNLDFWTQTDAEIEQLFRSKAAPADVALIEANKGLFDGLSLDGSDSNAALAQQLRSPVVLVLDCRGTIRGIAPLILGYQSFQPKVAIAGVILNFVGGSRHEAKLRNVLQTYTDVPCLGAFPNTPELNLEERYLGLMPSNEDPQALHKIDRLADFTREHIDLELLLSVAADYIPPANATVVTTQTKSYPLTIAYAHDEAFGFYYADDLDTFRDFGVRLVPVNTLRDQSLPAVDALFIGGGFPEKRIAQLSANQLLRRQIKDAINHGLPVYAECGGLMYLSRSIEFAGEKGEMVGAIPADTVMGSRPQGRGYIEYRSNAHHLWPLQESRVLRAHEFHYSRLEGLATSEQLVFDVQRGFGVDGKHDGIRIHNMLACYAHQRHTQDNPWIRQFLEFIQNHR